MQTDNSLSSVEYGKILYATDLSESGRTAFPHAASIAKNFNADLTVFHVVDNRDLEDLLGYVNEALWQEITKQTLEEARQILISRKRDNVEIRNVVQQFCEETIAGGPGKAIFSYDVKVEMGDALEKILEEAHNGGYDMLVVSKHGQQFTVRDAVMGNTARRLIRRCKIPVLVIPLPD